jgi:oligoribonuclease NrnB/cAMP/cGMP phosphodiesterase (DHH superfamily)
MWFDHHTSELERSSEDAMLVEGVRGPAYSAARIVYEYYEGPVKLPHLLEMVEAVDKVDSANLTIDEVIHPRDWVLLGFIMDPRTGMGRHKGFSVGNWELMEELMDACRNYEIEELLMLPNVAERIELYNKQSADYHEMIVKNSRINGDIAITDLRGVSPIYSGNRFLLYSIFPEQNISIWVADGLTGITMIAVGASIINRTSTVDVGALMLKYGGGGHEKVGTCQVPDDEAERVLSEIIAAINGEK